MDASAGAIAAPDSLYDALKTEGLLRGVHLRKLRELERQDELERQKNHSPTERELQPQQKSVKAPQEFPMILDYNTWLTHQTYHDDLKHIDYRYIDFGTFDHDDDDSNAITINGSGEVTHNGEQSQRRQRPLILYQDKTLGKGGFFWDAAHILGEYLAIQVLRPRLRRSNQTLVELGCGTGLCGILIAKLLDSASSLASASNTSLDVTITDLPHLMPLIEHNLALNFAVLELEQQKESSKNCLYKYKNQLSSDQPQQRTATMLAENDPILQKFLLHRYENVDFAPAEKSYLILSPYQNSARSTISIRAQILEWSCEQEKNDEQREDRVRNDNVSASTYLPASGHPRYDIIAGADIVASIYDPMALVCTIHRLAHDDTLVYIAFKERLTSVDRQFEDALRSRFHDVRVIPSTLFHTRNRNPRVHILLACRKRKLT